MAQTKIKAGLFEGIIGNGTDGYFLMSNGDGTMTWSSVIINPTVTSIAYPGSVTAADPAGGETITVTGTGFKTGATVTVGGTAAPAVSYVSETQITFTTPAKAAGDYDIVVTNTDTGSATYINGISYNGIPSWTTAAGSLGTFASGATISTITLQASEPDAGTITFNITNGALPTGLSLTGADIDGTTSLETADTLYTFTVTATDDESQATPRTFTITVKKQFINTENFTINTYTGNGSTLAVEGKIGTAADFNGVNPNGSVIDLPNLKSFFTQKQTFSVSMWFNTEGVSTDNSYLFSDYNSSSYNIFAYITTTGLLKVSNRMNGTTNTFTSSSAYDDSQWYHLVITNDATSSVVTVYINGSSIGTTNISANSWSTGSLGKLGIGAFYSTSNSRWQQSLKGKIDQVRIFNKALSSSEVTTLYGESNTSTTKSTTDIFDDGSGVALYEFEKGAIDTGGTNGYIGSAGVFDGSSSKITISSGANTPIDLTQESFSISMWFNTNTISSDQALISRWGTTAGTDRAILFSTRASDGKINLLEASGSTNYGLVSNTVLSANTWYHFVYTRSGTESSLYIDGTLDRTDSRTNSINSGGTIPFDIGHQYGGLKWFNGKIDQVRIFNKALSSSEVTTLYGETSASATKSTTDIFDDGSGVALYELEGNANDTGTGAIDSGQSAVFNGNNSYIDSGSSILGGTNYTVSLWFYANSLYTNAQGQNLLYNQYAAGVTGRHIVTIYESSFRIFIGGTTLSAITVPAWETNKWYHIAVVKNSSGFTVYINNTSYTLSTSASITTSTNFKIGKGDAGIGENSLDGLIDQVRVYSSALSSSDVEALVSETNVPTANLVAHYKLDGDATDETGTYNGTASNITYSDPAEFPTYDGTATNVSYAYDGTPTNVSFVGTSFQPDFIWFKERTTVEGHRLYDSIRGATKHLNTGNTAAEATNTAGLTSFDTNGFSIGNYAPVNTNNEDYVAWCWKAGGTAVSNTDGNITSQVSANQDAGFSIVTWTSDGTTGLEVGHGLAQQPELIINKRYSGATSNWNVYTDIIDGSWDFLRLNTTDTKSDSADTQASSSLIRNTSTAGSFVAYCFHSVDGYQKVGSYSGSSSTVTVTTGFQLRFLIIKRTNGNNDWIMYDTVRSGSTSMDDYLTPNTSGAEYSNTSLVVNVTSTGFTIASGLWAGMNESGGEYIYLAIA